MDEARMISSGRLVTGEDLWYLECVDKSDFECIDCRLPVNPCSYNKKINLKRPHFKVHEGTEHQNGCQFEEGTKILRNLAKKRSITTGEGFPLSYPSAFNPNLRRHEESIDNDREDSPGRAVSRPRAKSEVESGAKRKPHHYSTDSFRSIVKHYLNFPFDRNLQFSAIGIDGKTYEDCFRQIWGPSNPDEIPWQTTRKIYFAPASWKEPQWINDTTIRILLNRGFWTDKGFDWRFYLDIDTDGWPELTRKSFFHEFKKGLHEVRGTKDKELLVFFIGNQKLEDPQGFAVNDYRLIAVMVVEK